MKIRHILAGIWAFIVIRGVITNKNYTRYTLADWLILAGVLLIPYFIGHLVLKPKKNLQANQAPNVFINNTTPVNWTPQMQQDYENAVRQEQQSGNPKFHRTEKEEELSFQFSMNYSDKIFDLEEKFQDFYNQATSAKTEQEELELLKKTVDAFEKAKRFCYGKGKGGMIYFQDMWEYMHNSRNNCFSYIDDILDRIEDLGGSIETFNEPQLYPEFTLSNIEKKIIKKYRKYDVPGRLRIINESFKIMQTTKDIDTFFSRYNTAIEHCRFLELGVFVDVINSAFYPCLQTCYNRFVSGVKTEKGKQNRREKFIVSLAKYFNPDQVQQFIDNTK